MQRHGILKFGFYIFIFLAYFFSPLSAQQTIVNVHFDQPLRTWDGFGVNYVETRHTRDYSVFPQDYGGFKYLDESERQKVIEMIFGKDGLRPSIIKAFLDPFHEPENDNNNPYYIDMDKFDHTTTTKWILYFCREAEKKIKEWDGELTYLAGLYGPPDWMSKQKCFRGRDLDPAMKLELAEYIVSWAKYLKESEGFNVKYISMHNEGEDARRWRDDGVDDTSYYHHDFNMLWSSFQIVDFLRIIDYVLYANNMLDVSCSCGETSNWLRLHDYWYHSKVHTNIAEAIRLDAEAMKNIGLITSHGFMKKYDSEGVDILREANPGLHAWTTSYTWDPMNHEIVEDARQLIYDVKCNALIPWAIVHNAYESDKLHPPMKFRISSNACSPFLTDDGELTVTKAYYYFKQLTRAGQANTRVSRVETNNENIQALAFDGSLTKNPDAFVIINKGDVSELISIRLSGNQYKSYKVYRTSEEDHGDEDYKDAGVFKVKNSEIQYEVPAKSVTTFFGE